MADNVALALKTLGRQQELAENLNVTQGEVKQLRKQLGAASEIVGRQPVDVPGAAGSRAGRSQSRDGADPWREWRG